MAPGDTVRVRKAATLMIVEFGSESEGMTKTTGRAARSECRPKSCETFPGGQPIKVIYTSQIY
jgi:hypothetical protein